VGRLWLGLGPGLALGLQLGIGIGFRRNHSWWFTFTPSRNHSLCLYEIFIIFGKPTDVAIRRLPGVILAWNMTLDKIQYGGLRGFTLSGCILVTREAAVKT